MIVDHVGRPFSSGETSGSPQRAAPRLDSPVQTFDVAAEVEKLRTEESWRRNRRNARTLVKEPDFRVVLVALHDGARLEEHRARPDLDPCVARTRPCARPRRGRGVAVRSSYSAWNRTSPTTSRPRAIAPSCLPLPGRPAVKRRPRREMPADGYLRSPVSAVRDFSAAVAGVEVPGHGAIIGSS